MIEPRGVVSVEIRSVGNVTLRHTEIEPEDTEWECIAQMVTTSLADHGTVGLAIHALAKAVSHLDSHIVSGKCTPLLSRWIDMAEEIAATEVGSQGR